MANSKLRYLVESALMIAVATVLSELKLPGIWALGGGITICSMLPLVIISFRYGCKKGCFTAFVYSVLQMFLGLDNIQYATSVIMAISLILFDYVVAYTVIGLASVFRGKIQNDALALIFGIIFTFSLRFACHFITGTWIWEALWPNELGWAPAIWSLAYNASYMVPEMIITSLVGALIYRPLKKYFELVKQ